MNGKRKSAKERESVGWKLGLLGLILLVFGLVNSFPEGSYMQPVFIVVGLVIAVIGAIMWGAGMARRD